MTSPQIVALYTTLDDLQQAEVLADSMVAQRFAACGQIETIRSVYRWQGAIEHATEYRLLFKTTATRCEALVQAVRQRHPYELPALWWQPLAGVDPAYARWVDEGCRDATSGANP